MLKRKNSTEQEVALIPILLSAIGERDQTKSAYPALWKQKAREFLNAGVSQCKITRGH